MQVQNMIFESLVDSIGYVQLIFMDSPQVRHLQSQLLFSAIRLSKVLQWNNL